MSKRQQENWLEKQDNADQRIRGAILYLEPIRKGDIFDLRLNKLLKQFGTLPKEELASSLSFYLNVVQNDGTYKEEEKQGEQKPAWSEEDKRKIDRIYSILSQAADTHAFSTSCRLIGDKECIELQDFLKSLRPQIIVEDHYSE